MLMLRVPFVYEGDLLRSSRHRHSVHERIREYTDVLIEELAAGDLDLAILATDGEGDRDDPIRGEPYFSRGEHLYRQARNVFTGESFDVRSFEDALSPRYDLQVKFPWEAVEPIPFHRHSLPGPGSRWDHRYWDPLWAWEEHKMVEAFDWKPTRRFVTSTRTTMLALAQAYLSKAIVAVDGEIFVACTEPVWTVRETGEKRGQIFLNREVTADTAVASFRLDRLEHAKEWARRIGDDEVPLGDAEIVDPDSIARDDEWELANRAVALLRHLPRDYFHPDRDRWAPVSALIASIPAVRGRIASADVPQLLDCFGDALAAHPLNADASLSWADREILGIVGRWTLAKERGMHGGLTDEDLAALVDLPMDDAAGRAVT